MLAAYLPSNVDPTKDFFLSSLLANDEVKLNYLYFHSY